MRAGALLPLPALLFGLYCGRSLFWNTQTPSFGLKHSFNFVPKKEEEVLTCSVESSVGRAEGVARDEIDVGPLARGKLKVNKERIFPSPYLQNPWQVPRYSERLFGFR